MSHSDSHFRLFPDAQFTMSCPSSGPCCASPAKAYDPQDAYDRGVILEMLETYIKHYANISMGLFFEVADSRQHCSSIFMHATRGMVYAT